MPHMFPESLITVVTTIVAGCATYAGIMFLVLWLISLDDRRR